MNDVLEDLLVRTAPIQSTPSPERISHCSAVFASEVPRADRSTQTALVERMRRFGVNGREEWNWAAWRRGISLHKAL